MTRRNILPKPDEMHIGHKSLNNSSANTTLMTTSQASLTCASFLLSNSYSNANSQSMTKSSLSSDDDESTNAEILRSQQNQTTLHVAKNGGDCPPGLGKFIF